MLLPLFGCLVVLLHFTCLEYSLRKHIAAPFGYFYRTLYLLLYKSLITFQQQELS